MIKKEGNRWVLYSKSGGKKLGEHSSKSAAIKQEQAILISKKKK